MGKKRQEEEFRLANGGVLREMDTKQRIITYLCRLLVEMRAAEAWKSYFEVVIMLDCVVSDLFETADAGILPHRNAFKLRKELADELSKGLSK